MACASPPRRGISSRRRAEDARFAARLCVVGCRRRALRIADSFTGEILPAPTLAVLYFVTDVFLLAGIAGVWWRRRPRLGWAAMAGLTVFVLGILAIRVSVYGVLGANGYQLGAAVALIGLAVYAMETLLRRNAAPLGAGSMAGIACLRRRGRGGSGAGGHDDRGRRRVRRGFCRGGCRDVYGLRRLRP